MAVATEASVATRQASVDFRGYAVVTAAYWGFTLTDGALHMLVLLHFHRLGYSPVQLAFLLFLYEVMGILTNLFGGWIASRVGLNRTLLAGLFLQVVALLALSIVQPIWLPVWSVVYVMICQGLSGVAKDLTKMSSKSAVKLVVTDGKESSLLKWVALLTGSKNALKGLGFFLGGLLLQVMHFAPSLWLMAGLLAVVLVVAALTLQNELGKSKSKVGFGDLFAKSREINYLSAARFFLFGARDVWFVVALPLFLYDQLQWDFWAVGGFLAAWIIAYGFVQAIAPKFLPKNAGAAASARAAQQWGFALAAVPALMAMAWVFNFFPIAITLVGLMVFGLFFAVNSAVHSYLILAYTGSDDVAVNVGFYYSANAAGRLVGTLLSGAMFLAGGMVGCLWTSAGLVLAAALLALALPTSPTAASVLSPAGATDS